MIKDKDLQRFKTAEQKRFFTTTQQSEVTRYSAVSVKESTAKKAKAKVHYLQDKLLAISAVHSQWLAEGGSKDRNNAMLAVGNILNSLECDK